MVNNTQVSDKSFVEKLTGASLNDYIDKDTGIVSDLFGLYAQYKRAEVADEIALAEATHNIQQGISADGKIGGTVNAVTDQTSKTVDKTLVGLATGEKGLTVQAAGIGAFGLVAIALLGAYFLTKK